jgi:hypothetical protein
LIPLKASLATVLAAFLAVVYYPPAIAYFTNMRPVQAVPAQAQNFIVLDDIVWAHARPDLADLRLYDGQVPVPYALREQRTGVSNVEQAAKILNLGTVAGHTEFDLDTADAAEYNRIELQLTSRDFVVAAQIEGRNDLSQHEGARLGSSTLYDFTRENLGSNSVLKLPLSSFAICMCILAQALLRIRSKARCSRTSRKRRPCGGMWDSASPPHLIREARP